VAGLIDTHLHLARHEFDADREQVWERARSAGVAGYLHVGFDQPSIDAALRLAAGDPASWVSAGIHPHDARSYDEAVEELLRGLARDRRIVAIVECGLDFFRDLSPRDVQRDVFRRQIRLAREVDLPLVLHVRDAYPQARELLEQEGLPPRRGVFHAFAGDAAFARWAVEAGFHLGIGGPLTYPKGNLVAALHGLPGECFLLETDAPWLPPQPWRGQRNEPAYLRHTATRLAEIGGVSLDALAAVCAGNFERLFRVALPPAVLQVIPSTLPEPQRPPR
jgi:TatD DNase family protein